MKKSILVLALVLASCTTAKQTVEPETAAPVPTTKGWKYDAFVESRLTEKMVTTAPGGLCLKWNPTMAKKFWVSLIRATAYSESGYNPNTDYTEKFPDDKGNLQISSGLMQLSVDDRKKGTPVCSKLTKENIHDPEINLGCSIEIMNWLIGSRPTLQASLGRYWSTIRDGKIFSQMKREIPECF